MCSYEGARKSLSEFVNEKLSHSPEMVIRILLVTGTTAESWRNMQLTLTLWQARQYAPRNVVCYFLLLEYYLSSNINTLLAGKLFVSDFL